jgi:hypothetical protein
MYMLVWGKFVLYKYVTCWLVTVSRKSKSYSDKLGEGGEVAADREENNKNPELSLPLRKECVFCRGWASMALKKMEQQSGMPVPT